MKSQVTSPVKNPVNTARVEVVHEVQFCRVVLADDQKTVGKETGRQVEAGPQRQMRNGSPSIHSKAEHRPRRVMGGFVGMDSSSSHLPANGFKRVSAASCLAVLGGSGLVRSVFIRFSNM